MLKFKDFVNEVLDSNKNESLIVEATSGEVLFDTYDRFKNRLNSKSLKEILATGINSLSNLPSGAGSDIMVDKAYITIYPTVIKVRSKETGERILEFKLPKKSLDDVFQSIESGESSKINSMICAILWLMEQKPTSLSWAPKDSLKKEVIALDNFNRAIKAISEKDSSGVVKIVLSDTLREGSDPHMVEVEGVDKVGGTPRADFELRDKSEQSFIFISHKDGKDPKGFQQYSGMTLDKNIESHPEVREFADKIKSLMKGTYSDEFKAGYATPVKDPRLAALAMFGNEFGGNFSKNNCQILMQGALMLDPSVKFEGAYTMKSTGHMVINPQLTGKDLSPSELGEYWPHLYVRRSKDLNQFGIKGARFMILSSRKDIIPKAIINYNSI